ncbi:LysM peptidoglycan-binding domain-containing protein [bacterium]|nr:LysM peptidoglycan-binding domain-containing protein [bacterium]
MRKTRLFALLILILAGMLASACSAVPGDQAELTASPAQSDTLRAYPTGTPTLTPLPTGYVSPTPSPTITPTPTLVYYEIQLGDDMYSIAFRYGLEPAAVMTANPDVDPRAMIVGTPLLIPITPTPPPTATATSDQAEATEAEPEEEPLASPDCYPDALGGLWCFLYYTNDGEDAQENVSATFTLGTGAEPRQETAITPLNLLPAGESLPLVAYFQPPLPEDRTVTADIDFSLPVMPDDDRYLEVTLDQTDLDIQPDGSTATVTGTISIPAGGPDAAYVWVSATALDADGQVLTVRRWQNDSDVLAGGELGFEIVLYSLGGPIDHVDLLAEAQPAAEE